MSIQLTPFNKWNIFPGLVGVLESDNLLNTSPTLYQLCDLKKNQFLSFLVFLSEETDKCLSCRLNRRTDRKEWMFNYQTLLLFIKGHLFVFQARKTNPHYTSSKEFLCSPFFKNFSSPFDFVRVLEDRTTKVVLLLSYYLV